jgi:hypothetical protein
MLAVLLLEQWFYGKYQDICLSDLKPVKQFLLPWS